jgi:hypothetical protein
MELVTSLAQPIVGAAGTLIAAGLVLFIGWLVAWIVGALVRRLLHRTSLDNRLASWVAGDEEEGAAVPVEKWVGRAVFWLIFLFALVAFFEVLGLTVVTGPLNQLLTAVTAYIPRIIGAALLLLVAWILASILRFLVVRVLKAAELGDRLGSVAGVEKEDRARLAKALGDVVYWLVFLLFLPAVLGALAVEGLLIPVEGMINVVLAYLPNIFAAGIILAIGWFAARIVQRIVTNLLVAVGADKLGEKVGLDEAMGKQTVSGVVGLICYVLVLIPVIVAALNALGLEAITAPASDMLGIVLLALPRIFAAILVLAIAYVVGRLLSQLLARVLAGIGFDAILMRLGLTSEATAWEPSPSQIAGYLVLVGTMLLASMEASQLMGFTSLATMISGFTVFLLQVILGLVIFGFGLWLANFAAQTVQASGAAQASLFAMAARVSILIISGAIALTEMGLANQIVTLAFGLLLAAFALAAALAFGLGGRETAGRQLEEWMSSLRPKK